MPFVSQAQNRLFRWAAEYPGAAKRQGIAPGVTREFIESSHGEKVADLPERVARHAHGGSVSISGAPRPTPW